MAGKRSYGDGCGMAHGLDLVGERWALLVVRELLLGPKRFTDLRHGLPNASPNVLSERLRELEASGVIAKRRLPPPAASSVYELTDWGRELEPVVMTLGRWALGSPSFPRDLPVGEVSIALGMRTVFDPQVAGDLEGTIRLRFGEDTVYEAALRDGELDVHSGEGADPDATVTARDPARFAAHFGHGDQLEAAVEAGDFSVEGDEELVSRFLDALADPSGLAVAV